MMNDQIAPIALATSGQLPIDQTFVQEHSISLLITAFLGAIFWICIIYIYLNRDKN